MNRTTASPHMSAPGLGLLVVFLAGALLFGGTTGAPAAAATQNAIQIENAKPGTPNWYDFSASAVQDAINGYGSKISVNHGDSIDFFVTTTAPSFTIDIFRTGWYGGVGARLVASLGSFTGLHQAIPQPNPVTGVVAATSWTKTTTLAVPSDWVTGVYLAKLAASNGNKSFILFIVRNDGGTEPIMFQSSVTTAQAYNAWGGTSLYTNVTNKAVYPYAAATKVSFDRPFDPQDGEGAGQYLSFEYPFVRWAESQGYDLTYITNIDTHTNVNPFANHRVFLSVGHDEYWSKGMRDNLTSAIASGVNAAFFSANSMYWQIRLEANSAGTPNRVEVGYKDSSQFNTPPGPDPMYGENNAIVTSRWRDAPVNLPENALIGVMYQDQVQRNYDYVVQNASHWIYAGTGFAEGAHVPGIVGYEYDKVWNNGFSPAGLTILSNSPVVGCCEGSGNSFSNSTLYTMPGGGQVFASGTIQWSWGLDGYTANFVNAGIQKTTANILAAFSGAGTPAPAVTLTPTTLAFASQLVGTTSASQSSVLRNSGTAPLAIASIGLTGTNAADFGQTNDCPGSLPANGTCTITVTFSPSATGPRSASVQLTDNAAGSPHTVALTGTGTTASPAVTLTPANLAFGSQLVGTTSVSQASTLRNSGSSPLTITGISLAGTNAADFGQTNDCPGSLAANATCTITVTFAPTASGSRTASVSIADDAPGSPHALTLSGTGTTPAPAVTFNPTSLAFGSQLVGSTSAAQSSTLRNSGTAPLAIASISLTGTNAADFGQTNDCPGSLAANATCTITATFSPTASGSRTASVSVSDNATGSPHSVTLSGTGTTPGGAPIAFDKSLGTKTENAAGTTMTLTTNGAAVTGARVFLFAVWNDAARTLTSVSGGGLTWTIDVQGKDDNNDHVGIASAYAPTGLATGSVLTATFSGSVTHGLIAGASFTGVASTGFIDGTGTRIQGPVTAWNATVTTTVPGDLVLAYSVVDQNTTSTAAAPNTEIHDFGDVNYYGWSTSTYRLAATPGATTVNGTWASASGAIGTVTVAAAYKPAGGGAPAPAVTLSPTSLVFGAQAVGTTSASQSTTLTNSGTGPLTITSITVAGTNAADFARTTTCPLGPSTLAAGANCTIGATFAPTATGSRSASVQVADNASGSPHTVALSGTGTAPAVTLTPTSLAFGSQLVGTTSASQSSTLRNSGTAALAISGITVTGANASDFGQTSDCPASLAPGATCAITVTFSPSASGLRSANVQVSDNAAGSPQTLPLSGTGGTPAPAVTLAPGSLAFGSQLVGTTSGSQTSTLKNTGTALLTLTSIGLTGSNAGDFGQTNDCPGSLDVNSTCTITVTFSPTATGSRAASVSIVDDAPGSPHAVTVGGTGTAPAPAVTLTPASLAFGSQLVGTTSASQSSTLRNTGTAALTVSSIATIGANAADFGQSNDCVGSLAVNATCTITVTFSPTASGARAASISISDDATGSPHAVGLSGTGTAPAVSLSTGALNFGSQRVGTTSNPQTVTLTNTGTAPLFISGLAIGGTNSGDFSHTTTCPLSPASLAPSASCVISVRFSPSAAGPRSASLQVADNASGSPRSVSLSGTGSTTAIAFDKSLGTKTENVNGATMTLTTSGAAVSGARVILFVSWTHATRTLTAVSGGGLTWSIDRQQKAAGNNGRVAIASAAAPSGVNSGVVLTATFSGPVSHGLIAAASFTGVAATSSVDASASATGTGTAWSASLSTANADDLVIGFSTIDANATSTPTAPNTEIHDVGNVSYYGWATTVYRIETTSGSKTVNGVWSTSNGSTGSVTIVVAYKSS